MFVSVSVELGLRRFATGRGIRVEVLRYINSCSRYIDTNPTGCEDPARLAHVCNAPTRSAPPRSPHGSPRTLPTHMCNVTLCVSLYASRAACGMWLSKPHAR